MKRGHIDNLIDCNTTVLNGSTFELGQDAITDSVAGPVNWDVTAGLHSLTLAKFVRETPWALFDTSVTKVWKTDQPKWMKNAFLQR